MNTLQKKTVLLPLILIKIHIAVNLYEILGSKFAVFETGILQNLVAFKKKLQRVPTRLMV